MLNIITKIWNLLPALLGAIQSLLPAIKEVIMIAIRIIDIFTWSETKSIEIIGSINKVYDKVNSAVEKFKNAMLGL